jgi:hypothetical protein
MTNCKRAFTESSNPNGFVSQVFTDIMNTKSTKIDHRTGSFQGALYVGVISAFASALFPKFLVDSFQVNLDFVRAAILPMCAYNATSLPFSIGQAGSFLDFTHSTKFFTWSRCEL